jgi:ChrR-like protein with cupin domain
MPPCRHIDTTNRIGPGVTFHVAPYRAVARRVGIQSNLPMWRAVLWERLLRSPGKSDAGSANKHKRDREEGDCYESYANGRNIEDPGHTGTISQHQRTVTLKVLNSDESFGPAAVILRIEPGSEIPRHLHEHTTELSYVLEGDFINEGIAYSQGTEINVKPMTPHGPHTTKNGCSVLVRFS